MIGVLVADSCQDLAVVIWQSRGFVDSSNVLIYIYFFESERKKMTSQLFSNQQCKFLSAHFTGGETEAQTN